MQYKGCTYEKQDEEEVVCYIGLVSHCEYKFHDGMLLQWTVWLSVTMNEGENE